PPDKVLKRLNRDLIGQELADNPFITMIYVLFNHEDGTLRFARAGHPHPLYIPCQGDLRLWQVEGSLLGVFDSEFPVQTHQLQPGDKVLLYSDGIESARFENHSTGTHS